MSSDTEVLALYYAKHEPRLARYLQFNTENRSWGWHLSCSKGIVTLESVGATPVINYSNFVITVQFVTRQQRRTAISFITATMEHYLKIHYDKVKR